MTKLEELDALAAFRRSMPKTSYLRPWLDNVFGDVQDSIMSDTIPTKTYTEVGGIISALYATADKDVAGMLAAAERKAEGITEDARHNAERIKARAISALRAMLDDAALIY